MYYRLPLFLSVRLIVKPTIITRNPSIKMPPRSPKMITTALLVECPKLLPKMESYNTTIKYNGIIQRESKETRRERGERERARD